MITQCTCKNEFQDKQYGKNNRIHTEGKDKQLRCTVCGPIARDQQRLKLHAANHIKNAHG